MVRPTDRRTFLGVGREAPPPTGPEDRAFRAAMLRQAGGWTFRLRVNLWSRLTCRGPFPWARFVALLEEAEYHQYATTSEAAQSLGWFGRGMQSRWRFGVAGWRIPLYGPSAMRHELFHAAQDLQAAILDQPPSVVRSLMIEYSAHLWGGPLLGLPLAYGGSLFIVLGLGYITYALTVVLLGGV